MLTRKDSAQFEKYWKRCAKEQLLSKQSFNGILEYASKRQSRRAFEAGMRYQIQLYLRKATKGMGVLYCK